MVVHVHDAANLVILTLLEIVERDGLTLTTSQMLHQMGYLGRLHGFALLTEVVAFDILSSMAVFVAFHLVGVGECLATELVEQTVFQRNQQIRTQVVDGILVVAFHVHLHENIVNAVLQELLVAGHLQAVVVEHLNVHVV